MKAVETDTLYSSPSLGGQALKSFSILILSVLLAVTLLWQLEQLSPATASQSYAAPALDLSISGALNTSLRLNSLDNLAAAFSPAAFHLIFDDAPIAFELEFDGQGQSETSIYDLSSGTYLLSLTLLNEGEAYHSFTATQGTVELVEGETTVTAFLKDNLGQQLFVNLRFDWPETSQACSESYRFCFNVL